MSTKANFRKPTERAPVSPTSLDIWHAYKPNRQSPCDRKANHRDRSNAHTKPVYVRNLTSDGPRDGSMGGGAAWAGSPSTMETGAPVPKAQGRQFLSPFAEHLSPGCIFTQKALYGRPPVCEGTLVMREGALFATF